MPRCERCNQSFRTLNALRLHERDSPAHAVSYACNKCDRSFSNEDALQQHQRDSPAHIPSHECRRCDRSFRSEDALQRHQRYSTAHTQQTSTCRRNTPLDQFFMSFPKFNYDPAAFPSDEMQRLRRHYGWGRNHPKGEDAWDRYQTALVQEFNSWYESNNSSLQSWQGLCTVLKVRPLPTSTGACRQVCV
jgi:hypothetical protein